MPSVEDYFGPRMADYHRRMFNRPVEVLGYHRQFVHSNWKLYADNTHDPYHRHASLAPVPTPPSACTGRRKYCGTEMGGVPGHAQLHPRPIRHRRGAP